MDKFYFPSLPFNFNVLFIILMTILTFHLSQIPLTPLPPNSLKFY